MVSLYKPGDRVIVVTNNHSPRTYFDHYPIEGVVTTTSQWQSDEVLTVKAGEHSQYVNIKDMRPNEGVEPDPEGDQW